MFKIFRRNKKQVIKEEFIPRYKFGQIIEGIAIVNSDGDERYYIIGKLVAESRCHIFVLETQDNKQFKPNYVVSIAKENICKVHEIKGEDINE